MSAIDYLDLCRLCLVKDQVSVSIFEDEGANQQIFHKIATCLPVKVNRDDRLPQKLCNECVCKVEMFYQYWNTTANAEKQLLQWLNDAGDDKQTYVLDSNVVKSNQSEDEANDQTNNISINVIQLEDMPIMISGEEQMPSVSMTSSTNVQPVAGTSSQAQIIRKGNTNHEVEEGSTEDDNTEDDECDVDEGLKEEIEVPNAQPSYVTIPCDAPGPSGLQQQKMEIEMQQDDDPKSGYYVTKVTMLTEDQCQVEQMKGLCDGSTELVLTEHLRVAKTENIDEIMPTQTIVQCALCEGAFLSEEDLAEHVGTHHLDTQNHMHESEHNTYGDVKQFEEVSEVLEGEDDMNEGEEEMIETENEDQKVFYVCQHCNQHFVTTLELRNHQQTVHSEFFNNADEEEDEDGNLEDDIDINNDLDFEKLFSCQVCEYTTPHKQNLINHEKRHNLNYKFHCDICGAGFCARNIYQEHLLKHSGEKPFQCDICNATFRYRQGLRLHTKLHQPDYIPPQKKHLCELCNKRFSRKQVLLVHKRTHNTSGPQYEFICHICGKAVSSKTYLAVHVRKHTGEKPHVCDLCGKGFISQNYLSVHRRTHTGERPHKCPHCDKRFTQRTTLVVHLRGHTGDRPYGCDLCHKSFASKTMLNSHLKTHAKQNARAMEDDVKYETEVQPEQLDEYELQEALQPDTELNQNDEMSQEEEEEEEDEQSQSRTIQTVTVLLPG